MDLTNCDPMILPPVPMMVDSAESNEEGADEFTNPAIFSLTKLQMIEEEIVFAAFLMAVVADIASNGISGDANSRWLSFLDSFSHGSSWSIDEPDLALRDKIIGAILTKYGSGLVVSLLLGVTPAFMQTTTSAAFAISLVLAHTNVHLARLARSKKGPWRWLFVGLGALYKSRKIRFAVAMCNTLPQSLVLGTLSIELTGWFVVASRSYVKHEPPLKSTVSFIYQNRLRLFFTVGAVLFVFFQWHPLMLLVLLGLHKASSPDETGHSLRFEF